MILNFQAVTVINLNDNPELKVPNITQTVLPFSSFDFVSSKDIHHSERKKCRTILNGIQVNDKDKNIDYVRVYVGSQHGILTLNDKYLHLADFISCSKRNEIIWNCKGNGNGENEVNLQISLLHHHVMY